VIVTAWVKPLYAWKSILKSIFKDNRLRRGSFDFFI